MSSKILQSESLSGKIVIPQVINGAGILDITQTTASSEDDGFNIVTVRLTDGSSVEFKIKNGSKGSTGAKGDQGIQGPKGDTGPIGPIGPSGNDGVDGQPGTNGKDGVDGITPHIGDNGNWFIGDTDTGKPSRGEPGQDASSDIPTDTTLTISGQAADAAAVGEVIGNINSILDSINGEVI